MTGQALTCAACGTTVREFRVRCGRCGGPLVLADSPDPPTARRSLGAAGVVVGCLALGGLTVMTGGGPSDTPAPVVASAPAASISSLNSRPATIATAGSVPAPEPVAAALDTRDGVAAYTRGDIRAALEEFTEAVGLHPDDAEAQNNLGQVLVRSGRAREAIAHFDRAIAIADDRWAYHFNRARAYGELKQWARAVAGYRDAARLFPEDYVTHFNLARALQTDGDLPGAIAAFQQAIQLAPGQPGFHLSYGHALEVAHRPRDAAAAYRSFLELEPASPEAEKIKVRIAQLEGTAPEAARAANP